MTVSYLNPVCFQKGWKPGPESWVKEGETTTDPTAPQCTSVSSNKSVVVIRDPDKRQLREGGVFGLQFQATALQQRNHSASGLQQLLISHPQPRAERNTSVHACLPSARSPHVYPVQKMMSSTMGGPSHFSWYNQDSAPQVTWPAQLLIEIPIPAGYRLCQADNYSSAPLCPRIPLLFPTSCSQAVINLPSVTLD